MEPTPVELIVSKLKRVKKTSAGYYAFCPAHDDTKKPSLKVDEGDDGRAFLYCHAGCTYNEIMEAIGLEPKDGFPRPIVDGNHTEYRYKDAEGRLKAIKHRYDKADDKSISWEKPNGSKGLGGTKTENLPLWGAEAIPDLDRVTPVVVTEGEKAAAALTAVGIAAVGTGTGANGTPSKESLKVLEGRRVVLWPDADEIGQGHMRRIGKMLTSVSDVRWFEWPEAPEKGDAADHPGTIEGGWEEQTRRLVDSLACAPRFVPPHDPATDGAATFAYALSTYEELRRLRRENGGVSGIRSGLPKVDKGIHGLNNGYSYLIAARPNVGKSLWAGQIALTAALAGHRVLLQTPEMDAGQYLDRFACYMSNVNYFDAQDGDTTDEEEAKLNTAAEAIAFDLPIVVDEWGGQDVGRVRKNIERHEPELVVIDYLQKMQHDESAGNRNNQVGQISRDLNRLKRDYKVPVVIAAQLNRAGINREKDGEPWLTDLRDSGEIEQDADVVLMLHRPDMTNPDVRDGEEDIYILCRKNRMGKLWRTTVHFVDGQQWFTDTPPGNPPVWYA